VKGITECRGIKFYGESFLQVSLFKSDLVKKYEVDSMQAHTKFWLQNLISNTSVGGNMKWLNRL